MFIMGSLTSTPTSEPPAPSIPSVEDVYSARTILRSLRLPPELALQILEHAEYFPSQRDALHMPSAMGDNAFSLDASAAMCYLISSPVPRGQDGESVKVKSVSFKCKSSDQGWTSHTETEGTYKTSSWLELSILRPLTPNPSDPHYATTQPDLRPTRAVGDAVDIGIEPRPDNFQAAFEREGWALVPRPEGQWDRHRDHWEEMKRGEGRYAWWVQGNVVAQREKSEYHVVWKRDGEWQGNEGAGDGRGFVECLRPGDRIAVWARYKRRMWEIHVEQAEVEIRYSI